MNHSRYLPGIGIVKTTKQYCTTFGCGRRLTLIEQLAGVKCRKHMNIEKPDINKFIKV